MILDTNAVSALLDGDPALETVLAGADRHHLPAVTLGEYRYGLKFSRQKRALESLLDTLEAESFPLGVDSTTARQYSDIRSELKQAGRPIPENDIWIAATASVMDAPLITTDGDYDHLDSVYLSVLRIDQKLTLADN